jgi:hypothetical protein
MIWTAILDQTFRLFLGPAPEVTRSAPMAVVHVADGVGGLELCVTGLRHAVARSGRPLSVQSLPWSHGPGRWFLDLTDTANHKRWAQQLVERIEADRETGGPCGTYLLGKSGGCGVIIRALEQLPPGSVDTVVLLAPAISADYPLHRALDPIREKLIVFWSPLDVIVLGAGTCLFGTIDRKHSLAAGLVGFRSLDRLPSESREKVQQIRWSPRMAKTGFCGGHVGTDLPWFLGRFVLPWFGESGRGLDQGSGDGTMAAIHSSGAGGGEVTAVSESSSANGKETHR